MVESSPAEAQSVALRMVSVSAANRTTSGPSPGQARCEFLHAVFGRSIASWNRNVGGFRKCQSASCSRRLPCLQYLPPHRFWALKPPRQRSQERRSATSGIVTRSMEMGGTIRPVTRERQIPLRAVTSLAFGMPQSQGESRQVAWLNIQLCSPKEILGLGQGNPTRMVFHTPYLTRRWERKPLSPISRREHQSDQCLPSSQMIHMTAVSR